jgi:ketosteroid isomerase-like protein
MNLLRRLLATAVLALVLAPLTPASAQDPQLHTASATELAVTKVLLAQEAAWNRGDIDGFVQGYKDSPDTLFISRGIDRGFSEMVGRYHREYPSRAAMGNLAFSEIEVHSVTEDVAVAIGRFHLDRNKKEGGNADGLFSLVLQKTDKGWKIVVDHTT